MLRRYRMTDHFDRPIQLHKMLSIVALVILTTGAILTPAGRSYAQTGCCTVRGNVDCDPSGGVDISDLSRLIDYMLISFDPLCCPDAGNVDGSIDGVIDISDLSRLIDFMLISFAPLEPCESGLLPYEQKQLVFDGVDSVYNSLTGLSLDTIAARLVAYLLTQPDIDTAAVMDGISVWARFTDHTIISIPNNTFVEDGAGASEPAYDYSVDSTVPENFTIPARRFPNWNNAELALRRPVDPAAFAYEIPSSIQARIMCTVSPTCFPSVNTTAMKNLLENNGYVTVPSSGSVPSLFNVRNDGAYLYIGHGGPGMTMALDTFLALWTTTRTSAALDGTYRGLLAAEELVYMRMRDFDPATGACGSPWHYGFTGRFVAQYMYFVSNSFVYITACQSDSVPSLRNGFKLAGASAFAGWSKTVHVAPALKAHEFLFDRLLGANASVLMSKENPPQRPFDVDPLWQDMKNRGIDTDPLPPNAKLRIRHLLDNFGLLAPSIRYMAVLEHNDTLYITGMFGTDPGPSKRRVYVGGTDMLVYDWQPQMITCFIPNTGVGSVGPVTVEVDGLTGPSSSTKRKSNVVNLTEWNGRFTYTQDDFESLEGTIVIDARLRADIHPFRDKPHETPKYYSVIFPAKEDSYGTATVSGTASYTVPDSDPVNTTTWTWHGTRALQPLWENDPTGFLLTGYVDGNIHQFRLHVVSAEHRDLIETVSSTASETYDNNLLMQIPLELYDTPPGYFYIQMNSVWDILGDSRTVNTCCSRNPANETGIDDIVHTFSWPTFPASWAPDPTAAQ